MKRFNSFNVKATIVWLACIFVLLGVAFYHNTGNEDIHTQRFCAYGHVFVEFERAGKVWGTVFLNERGKPAKCDEEDSVRENTNIGTEI